MKQHRKKALVLRHAPYEAPANIGAWLTARGYAVSMADTYAGVHLPTRVASTHDLAVMMGGPQSVRETHRYPEVARSMRTVENFLHLGKPVLGVCLGSQAIAHIAGAKIFKSEFEFGFSEVQIASLPFNAPLIEIHGSSIPVFQWHGENFEMPRDSQKIFTGEKVANQGFLWKSALALQFHLELNSSLFRHWQSAMAVHHPELVPLFPQDNADKLKRMKQILFDLLDRWVSQL